ncbi:MAG: hypothetical protein OZ948_06720 [Deltaproteobacteria bacterium]|nr:hypothetical protein [Deltaproteobacteria bacterium]
MSVPVVLRCFFTAGARYGLGHAMRTLEVAREAVDRNWSVALALRGDAAAHALCAELLPAAEIEPWTGPDDAARPARHLFFDTREPIAEELRRGGAAGAHRVVLDRTDHVDDAELSVLPNLHGSGRRHPRLLQGGRWCVIPREFRALAARCETPARSGVLVTMGGADPHDLTGTLCEPLGKALAAAGADLGPVHVLIGRCFGRRETLLRRIDQLGFRVHTDLDRSTLGLLMQRSVFAVCGFGTTVYELAWFGTPALYLAHGLEDAADAEGLEAIGVGGLGGAAPTIEPEALHRRLLETVLDPEWRRPRSARARALLGDGRGAVRLVEAMDAARCAIASEGGQR